MPTISQHKVRGTVYDIADMTARNAIANLDDLSEENITSRFTFTAGKRIKAANGKYEGDDSFTNWKATQGFVSISGFNFIRVTMMARPGSNQSGLAFYSSNTESAFISGVATYDKTGGDDYVDMPIKVPDGATHIRTTYYSDTELANMDAPAFSCYGIKIGSYDYQLRLAEKVEGYKPIYFNRDITVFVKNAAPADTDANAAQEGQTIISKLTNRYIKTDGSTISSNENCMSAWIRLGDGVGMVRIEGNATNGTNACMLKSNSTTIGAPDFASGVVKPLKIPAGVVGTLYVPEDAAFLYVTIAGTSGEDKTPGMVELLVSDAERARNTVTKDVIVSAFDATEANYKSGKYIAYSDASHTGTVWSSNSNVSTILIPVDGAVKLSLRANTNYTTTFSFVQNNVQTAASVPAYASGYGHHLSIATGGRAVVDVPSDAKYLYLQTADTSGNDKTPIWVRFIYPKNRVSKKRPLFCFVDDDGKADALTWLEKVVDHTRIPINIALITGAVGGNTFISWDDVRRLKNKGFVFVNHTNGSAKLTTLTEEQVVETFETSQLLMEQHGLPDSDILVLPNGETNDTVTGIIKDYFRCALSTQQRINLPPINTFYLPRYTLDTNSGGEPAYVSKISEWKAMVDKTISINGCCIFYGHAYRADYTAQKRVDYIELVKYIASKGAEIVSLPEMLSRYGNVIEGDVTVGCDEVVG